MATFNFRNEGDISTSYTPSDAYQNAYQSLWQQMVGLNSDSQQARQQAAGRLDSVLNTAVSQFTNLVGRAPTQQELDQLVTGAVAPAIVNSPNGRSENNLADVNNQLSSYIGTNFQNAAKDYATQQLQDQQTQANSLAELFRSQGTKAINDTEASLMDYQNKLFERLRPQLITSLQAQGLLNTGGLNEAVAGAQGDLALSGSDILRQLRLQNEQQANDIAFQGAYAPYAFKQNNIVNQVPYMQGVAQDSVNKGYNTFLSNLDYQHQLGLMAQQNKYMQDNQPSFLKRMSDSAATGLGASFNPAALAEAYKNYGAGAHPAGAAGGAAVASARKIKKDITKLTEAEENDLYDRLMTMPINRWRYNTEDSGQARHLGTMVDEALPEIVLDDGHLSTVDYLGVLTLALKVQHRRFVEGK